MYCKRACLLSYHPRLFIHSFHSFIHSFIRSFVHSFIHSHLRQTANATVCTTWPSLPFPSRLLPIISTNKLVVSRNFLSIRIVLSFLYLSTHFLFWEILNLNLTFAVCRIRESAIFNSATKTAEPRRKAFRLPCLFSGGELRYWRHFIFLCPK